MTTIAFAGAGHISVIHGLAAKAAGLTPTAVASRRWEAAVVRAEQLGATPARYGDLPAGADLVLVCTPPAQHADDAIRALQGGAAAFIEKPLTTTLADADRLVTAAARTGGRVGYAENLAFAPAVQAALARRPDLGALHHLDVRVLHPRPHWGDFLTEGWGGGVLFDLGPHPLAVALLLARPARPVEVSARLHGAPDHPVDEHAELTVRFDSGLDATFVVSWRAPVTGAIARAAGSGAIWDLQAASADGVLRIELSPAIAFEADGETVSLPASRGDLPDPRLEQMGYIGQLEAFAGDVAAGREPLMNAGFGREILDLVCAGYASAADGGRPRELPYAGPRDRTPLQIWRS